MDKGTFIRKMKRKRDGTLEKACYNTSIAKNRERESEDTQRLRRRDIDEKVFFPLVLQ